LKEIRTDQEKKENNYGKDINELRKEIKKMKSKAAGLVYFWICRSQRMESSIKGS
jgi:hypothetical protein